MKYLINFLCLNIRELIIAVNSVAVEYWCMNETALTVARELNGQNLKRQEHWNNFNKFIF